MISQSQAESAADTLSEYLSDIHDNRMVCPELATAGRAAEIVSAIKGMFTEFGTTTEQDRLLEELGLKIAPNYRHSRSNIEIQIQIYTAELGDPLAIEKDEENAYLNYQLGDRPQGRMALWLTDAGAVICLGTEESPKAVVDGCSHTPVPCKPSVGIGLAKETLAKFRTTAV